LIRRIADRSLLRTRGSVDDVGDLLAHSADGAGQRRGGPFGVGLRRHAGLGLGGLGLRRIRGLRLALVLVAGFVGLRVRRPVGIRRLVALRVVGRFVGRFVVPGVGLGLVGPGLVLRPVCGVLVLVGRGVVGCGVLVAGRAVVVRLGLILRVGLLGPALVAVRRVLARHRRHEIAHR